MRLKLRREMRFYTNTTPTSNPVIPDEILFALTEMSEDTPQDKRYNYDQSIQCGYLKFGHTIRRLEEASEHYWFVIKQFSGQLPFFEVGLTWVG